MGGVRDFLFGERPSDKMSTTLTPAQQNLLNNLSSGLMQTIFRSTPTSQASSVTATPSTAASQWIISPYVGGKAGYTYQSDIGAYVPTGIVPSSASATTAGSSFAGVEAYPGTMTAPASPIQQQLYQKASDLMGGNKIGNKALQTFLNTYSGGYQPQAFDPSSILNLFQTSVYNPAMKSFQEEVLPEIAERFAGRGSFDSGGTLYTMTKSANDLMSNLMGQKASMLSAAKNAWDNQELQKFLGINSMLPTVASTLSSTSLAGIPYAMSLGQTQQAQNQAALTEQYQKWLSSQPYQNPYLNLLSIALGTPALTPVVSGGTTGLLGALAPGVGVGAGSYLASLLAS